MTRWFAWNEANGFSKTENQNNHRIDAKAHLERGARLILFDKLAMQEIDIFSGAKCSSYVLIPRQPTNTGAHASGIWSEKYIFFFSLFIRLNRLDRVYE